MRKQKTALDHLKELCNIDKIEKCYYINYEENNYMIELECKKVFSLLDEIVPNKNTKIINITFSLSTNENIILNNAFSYSPKKENFFMKINFKEKELYEIFYPDSLLKVYEHQLNSKIIKIPVKNEEAKILELLTEEEIIEYTNKNENRCILNAIEWINKVKEELKLITLKKLTDFEVLQNKFIESYYYIILPNDFNIDEIKNKETIQLVCSNDYKYAFNWEDFELDKHFANSENRNNKMIRSTRNIKNEEKNKAKFSIINKENKKIELSFNNLLIEKEKEALFQFFSKENKMYKSILIDVDKIDKYKRNKKIEELTKKLKNIYKKQKAPIK